MALVGATWFRLLAAAAFFLTVISMAGLELRQLVDLPTVLFLLAGTAVITLFSYKKGMSRIALVEKAKRNCLIIGAFGLFTGVLASLLTTTDIDMLPKNLSVSLLMIPYTVFLYWSLKRYALHCSSEEPYMENEPASAGEAFSGLTDREKSIVGLLLKGKGNREIAEELFVTESTVKKHVYNIYKKMGVKSRHELICLVGSNAPVR